MVQMHTYHSMHKTPNLCLKQLDKSSEKQLNKSSEKQTLKENVYLCSYTMNM